MTNESFLSRLGSPRAQSLRRHARPTAEWALPLIVMPGLVPGIHVLRPSNSKDVDGRDIGVQKARRPLDGYAQS